MSKLVYTYKENQIALLPLRIFLLLIILMLIFSKFFYIGIIVVIIIYFNSRKRFSRFKVYEDFIEIRNFFYKKNRYKSDFFKIIISETQLYDSRGIVLKTKQNEILTFVPRSKEEAFEIVKVFEKFGLTFVKSKAYKDLIKWSIKKEPEEGTW